MTINPSTQHDPDDLFVAEFYPLLGEYLAERHAIGYHAEAGRARFLGWLSEHAAGRGAGEESLAPDPVEDYLEQIGKVPPLGAEQEAGLAKRIEAARDAQAQLGRRDRTLSADARLELERIAEDGARATNRLLEANLRLVVSLADRFTGRGMPFLDLIQEGNLGLIRAVEKFDDTKGYPFSTYATWWIRQAMTRALAAQARTIRIPVHLVEVINTLARVQRQLRQDLGREPTPDELATELGVTSEKVIEAQRYRRQLEWPHPPHEDPATGGR